MNKPFIETKTKTICEFENLEKKISTQNCQDIFFSPSFFSMYDSENAHLISKKKTDSESLSPIDPCLDYSGENLYRDKWWAAGFLFHLVGMFGVAGVTGSKGFHYLSNQAGGSFIQTDEAAAAGEGVQVTGRSYLFVRVN